MQTLYVKKARPKRIGRELKQKMPQFLRIDCAECDKNRTCKNVQGVWLCVAECAPAAEYKR